MAYLLEDLVKFDDISFCGGRHRRYGYMLLFKQQLTQGQQHFVYTTTHEDIHLPVFIGVCG